MRPFLLLLVATASAYRAALSPRQASTVSGCAAPACAAPTALPTARCHLLLRGGGGGSPLLVRLVERLASTIETALPASTILAIAIALEIGATTCMKLAALGSGRWLVGVGLGYTLCFSIFPLALKRLPLSLAYAVWSGVGTAAAAIIGNACFGEVLGRRQVASIGLIVAGVVGLNT